MPWILISYSNFLKREYKHNHNTHCSARYPKVYQDRGVASILSVVVVVQGSGSTHGRSFRSRKKKRFDVSDGREKLEIDQMTMTKYE